MDLKRRRRNPQINIVPLVDVLIVLIFFFLMTMQFRTRDVLELVLPYAETAGQQQRAGMLVVAIKEDGSYFLNGEAVEFTAVRQAIADAGDAETETTLILQSDENTPMKHMVAILDETRKAGLTNVSILTRME